MPSLADRTDAELITLAGQGDKAAFGQLVVRHQTAVHRFARRLVTDAAWAADLAQEAIVQAYLSLDRLRDPSRFRAWLCGIVLNVFRSQLRDRKAAFPVDSGDLAFEAVPVIGAGPEEAIEERELEQVILDAIATLPTGDRDATLFFYYDQLSVREIAARLGTSAGAVKVRLHRVRVRLKQRLQAQHPEIAPSKHRRKTMVKVTVADVVRRESRDGQGAARSNHVVLLKEEDGQRVLPIWVGASEGQAIVIALTGFATPRPMTFQFTASLLNAAKATVEHVRVETLKGSTFYGVVKLRTGKRETEVDARPSDAIALALVVDCPIFVAEDVLDKAGAAIPKGRTAGRKGIDSLQAEISEAWRSASPSRPLTDAEIARVREDLFAAVFEK